MVAKQRATCVNVFVAAFLQVLESLEKQWSWQKFGKKIKIHVSKVIPVLAQF